MHQEDYYKRFLEKNLYPRELKNFNKALINFSSNDYLGLSQHPLLITRSQEFIKKYGVGSTSSRLVVGNLFLYENLEKQLAHAIEKPAALILGTGYQANSSILEALLDSSIIGSDSLVFCDKLCHASLLTGARFSGKLHRFKHNDLYHLESLLEKYADSQSPKFILIESIYSMDGDQADLPSIISLAKRHNAFLYVDDAHAVGVYGRTGWGKAIEYAHHIDMIMGTFSKGLGSYGAYIGCSETMRQYLINKCKGLIYSTGLPPAVLGAISAAIEIVPTLQNERQKVIMNVNKVRTFFQAHGLDMGNSDTHIIPWIIGDAKKTLYASQLLEKEGILGTTIRPPSVPSGKCRIRFCISSTHSDEHIQQLIESVQKVEQKL